VREDHEDEEQATRGRRDNDDVGGHDLSDVVRQKVFQVGMAGVDGGALLRHGSLRD
jgi:hypothetical protein